MAQEKVWDREYKNSKLLVKENIPSSDIVRFVRFLKKQKFDFDKKQLIDFGSGMGRNSFYFAEFGCDVTGVEISKTAIDLARKNAKEGNLNIDYFKDSIGEPMDFLESRAFDLALDVVASNSLNEKERKVFLNEANRVLKNGGYFFVKALCKDGDDNAKNLLKRFPGVEKDTYIMPETEIVERVWSKEDFEKTYAPFFKILHLEKKTSYSRMNNRSYKRNFWIAYLQK